MDIPALDPAARRIALVRRPADNLAEGQLTHIERVPVDLALARTQWAGYVAALAAEGWNTVEVEPAPLLPDSVFIEDAVISFGDIAVVTSPGAPTRRDETGGAADAVRDLGIPVHHLALPGTLDGGDVLKIGRTVYVGRSLRTNDAGIDQAPRHRVPARLHRRRGPDQQGAAPQVRRHGTARRHRDRLSAPRRRFHGVRTLPSGPGGIRHGRRRARAGRRADVERGPALRRPVRRARLPRRHRRHLRIRETRGLRHLPERAHPLTRNPHLKRVLASRRGVAVLWKAA
ncbi:hypothetical protein [Cryobacterium breve]|uniref:hypothetical protein n=1 Tax=Cryobacterium breve TaxID=1259258 RepID=UPI0032B2FB5A